MAGFDGEVYLRLCGERSLLARSSPTPFGNELVERARALVAVQAVAAERAQQVVDDYARAEELRGLGHGPGYRHRPARPSAPPIPPPRLVPSGRRTVQDTWGEIAVRYVSFDPQETRIAVRMRAATPYRPVRGRNYLPQPGLPSPTVADDRGTTAATSFSGGGSDEEWTGHYTTSVPLSGDTAWIEIDGQRLDLVPPDDADRVRVESLADVDPAQRYLHHLLETLAGGHHRRGGLEPAVEALIACGTLTADAPLVAAALDVAAALQHGGPYGPMPPAGGPPVALPPPWPALIAGRGRGGGPTGTVLVAAETPLLDGARVTVLDLESGPDTFRVGVGVAGGASGGEPFDTDVTATRMTFSATDDRGNPYLGGLNGWSGDEDGYTGEIEFWPALDPRATRLELAFTAGLTRAVVEVALPTTWGEPA